MSNHLTFAESYLSPQDNEESGFSEQDGILDAALDPTQISPQRLLRRRLDGCGGRRG